MLNIKYKNFFSFIKWDFAFYCICYVIITNAFDEILKKENLNLNS